MHYRDEDGQLLFQVVRYEPKDFRQRHPDGQGGHIWNLKEVRRVPYRLPEVLQAQDVFISEGEKDVDNLAAKGITATTCPQGAGKWPADFAKYFRGKNVTILPDNDDPGRKHAAAIARNLQGAAATVKILELPGLPWKGDVSDWLGAGGTAEKLLTLAADACKYNPAEDQGENSSGEKAVSERVQGIPLLKAGIDLLAEENDKAAFDIKGWPMLPDKALSGIAGRFTALATLSSEADPAAVLATFLCRAGVEFGTRHYLMVGDSIHHARISAVIVGSSSKARKGTSGKPVSRLFQFNAQGQSRNDPYKPVRESPGPLQSGQGLIYAVGDPVKKWQVDKQTGAGQWIDEDPGVDDKRLFVLDEELAAALQCTKREGNTL